MLAEGAQRALVWRTRAMLRGRHVSDLVFVGLLLAALLLGTGGTVVQLGLIVAEPGSTRFGVAVGAGCGVLAALVAATVEGSAARVGFFRQLALAPTAARRQHVAGLLAATLLGLALLACTALVAEDRLLAADRGAILASLAAVLLAGALARLARGALGRLGGRVGGSGIAAGWPMALREAWLSRLARVAVRAWDRAARPPATRFAILRRMNHAAPVLILTGGIAAATLLAAIALGSVVPLPGGASLIVLVLQLDSYRRGSQFGAISASFATPLVSRVTSDWQALSLPHVVLAPLPAFLGAVTQAEGVQLAGAAVACFVLSACAPLILWFWCTESVAAGALEASFRATILALAATGLLIGAGPLGVIFMVFVAVRARKRLRQLDTGERWTWIRQP